MNDPSIECPEKSQRHISKLTISSLPTDFAEKNIAPITVHRNPEII